MSGIYNCSGLKSCQESIADPEKFVVRAKHKNAKHEIHAARVGARSWSDSLITAEANAFARWKFKEEILVQGYLFEYLNNGHGNGCRPSQKI